jgi:hypothetical protein
MFNRVKWFTFANFAIVAIFILLIFAQANKKFVLDEVDFPAVAKTISQTGMPYEYRGENESKALGLWHPPLYAYSLGAFVKVFGANENMVRAFGMCCTLLSALLCLLIYNVRIRTTGKVINPISTIFLSLFLFHPYTIANTTLPDIDSTILPVTFLAFIYGLARKLWSSDVKGPPEWSANDTVFIAILFALNLWAKLTTPLVLIPLLLVIIYIEGFSLRRSILIASSVAILGAIFFLVTYALYCYLFSLPYDYTFRFLIHSFTKNSSGGGVGSLIKGVLINLGYITQFVNWLGLPFLFAFALTVSSLIFRKLRSKIDVLMLILAGVGLFVAIFYLSLTGAFGGFFKYPYPVFPILMLIVAHHFYEQVFMSNLSANSIRISIENREINISHAHIIIFIFFAVVMIVGYLQLVYVKDSVIMKGNPVGFSFLFVFVGMAILFGALGAKKQEKLFYKYGLTLLFATIVVMNFGISRSQAISPYPTKYHYGQIGLDETVVYLKSKLKLQEPIWSMKDIGLYASGVYYENYGSLFKTEAEIKIEFKDLIENKGVRYFVVTTGIGQDRIDAYGDLKRSLDACCNKDQEFGNLIIYKAK